MTGETYTPLNRDNTYSYDDAGNHLGPFHGETLTAADYDRSNQRTGEDFTYTAEGDPTTYKGDELAFDVEHHLTRYGPEQAPALLAKYGPDGTRMWKEVNDVRTTFCYDGETLVGQQTGQDDFVPIVHGPDGLIAFGETYYQFDPEGNVVHRLDADGELVNTSVYNAWGLATNVLPDGDPATVTDPFGYKGQVGYYTDHETGLILCTHRYYDPALGRWLTRDPIGYGGGVNLYGYCGNEPIGRGDDQGLDSYVFYDGAHFKKQALIEKDRLAKKYKTPVHMIDTRTTKQFVSSWNNMGKIGNRAVGIEGVSLLFHGKATTINIDWTKDQYLTTDPAGRTPAGRPAYYIGNLGDKPIEELRILTCNGGHLDVKDNVGRTFRRHLSYAGIISAYDGNLSYWPNGAPRLSLRKSQTKFFQIQKDVGAPLRNPKGEVYF